MGASEAFEGDIEAAARTVLQEAGGHRAKAKELLRRRMNGNGAANGKLNGSEVGYWRQLGALSLLDNIAGCAARLRARAAELAPEDAEAQMLVGVLHLRSGNLAAAESAFRRQIELGGAGTARASCAIAATPCWATCTPRARSTMRRWRPMREAQREVKALLEREPDNAGFQRDLSVTCDRIGDMHAAQGRARCGARELSPEPRDRRGAWPSAIRRTRSGSTICP